MANKQTREQLGVKPGDKIILKGIVSFARLDKAVEGEALARENERRAKQGMLKTKAFRSITIENPEIVKGEGTPLANFHAQSVYASKSTGKPTMSFESKSLFPPSFGHMQADGGVKEMVDPQKNPAQGQVVYLMISAFSAKGFNNLGSTFDAVVYAPGEIAFYEGKNSSLTGFGEAMNMPISRMTAGEQAQSNQNVEQKETVGVGAGLGAPDGQQGGFGGFGQAPSGEPNQGQPGQAGFGGFGQVPTGDPNQGQPNQGGFGGFGGFGQGAQDQAGQGAGVSNPFGNSQQRSTSPYA